MLLAFKSCRTLKKKKERKKRKPIHFGWMFSLHLENIDNWLRGNRTVKLSFSLFQSQLSTVLSKGVSGKVFLQAILMPLFFFKAPVLQFKTTYTLNLSQPNTSLLLRKGRTLLPLHPLALCSRTSLSLFNLLNHQKTHSTLQTPKSSFC